MMAPYSQRLLRVNLSRQKATTETIPSELCELFIGGRGIGVALLYLGQKPGVDPLGEENNLIFLTGPLAGTPAQSASRWMICTKSPLTGGYARSVGGADFGAWLRFAGYEAVVVEGKAKRPTYLHITSEGCEFLDARGLWGQDTVKTQEAIRGQHGDKTRVACIGPAGERLVKYAAVVSDRRTASRCGVGTVMGSKNLKAIAITASRNVRLFDPELFKKLAAEQGKIFKESSPFKEHKEWSTTTTQNVTNSIGIFPTRNFRYGQMKDCEKIYGEEYRKLRTGEFGCYNCSARCGKAHTVTSGPYAGAASEGPEYESIWVFSGSIDSTSIEATIRADQICDDLGLDTISAGNCVALAYELYEKGIIDSRDTDGLELVYGDHQAMVKLVRKIGLRQGFGSILAEGVARASRIIGRGAESFAVHTKGMELPAYEPRGAKSHGFNYATSNIGGSHCYGYAAQEVFGVPFPRPINRFDEAKNADIVIGNQDGSAAGEVGIACAFSRSWGWYPGNFGELLAAATGIELSADPAFLAKVGERIVNMERAFNVREGFGRKDDKLPHRMLHEPLHTLGAPGEGEIVREMEEFLDRYYELRGWTKDGAPTAGRLADLGLAQITRDLSK
jgi:aldehyde:ferredoxin oxidoreductase